MRKVIFSALLIAGLAAVFAPVVFAQEEKPFTIHGEVRTRMEYTDNANDFTDSGTDPGLGSNDDQASYWPYRIRIAAEGHFTKNVSAWIELQNAGVFGGDFSGPVKNGTVFGFGADSGVSLYQGNMTLDKLWSDHFSLTLGRSELVKGNELHLGDLDFYAGIVHDGAIANWDLKKVDITGWVTRPVEGSVFHPDNSIPPGAVAVAATPSTQYFWGAYVTWDIAKEQGLDLYFMENRNRDFTIGDDPSTLDMVGVRWFHDNVTKNGAVWNGEVAQEFGQISDLSTPVAFESGADLSGTVVEAMFGWNFKVGNVIHRPYGKFEAASGNKAPSGGGLDDKDEGFRPFFTDFHNRLGHGDWFFLTGGDPSFVGAGVAGTGGSGITAFSVGYTGWTTRHSWGAEFWDYSLSEDADLDPGAGVSNTSDLGTAFDLWYGFNYSKNVTFEASVSQLSPGDALTGTGTFPVVGISDDSAMRLYGQARLRF